ncbi:Clr5 domain-containing protein [Xylaria sp. FL1042]|nr:Clr5 domain-containing protein [Xylaria sp. FL1042]
MTSTAPDMIPTNRTSVPWAQDKDWDKHRTIITDLYLIRKKSLKDVKGVMEEEYGFRSHKFKCRRPSVHDSYLISSSPKMYKTRFKKWGVAKNRCKLVPLEEAGAERTIKPTEAVGRSSDGNQSPRQPVVATKNRGSAIISRHSRTGLGIRSMTPPDFYKSPEDAFHFIHIYYTTVRFSNLGQNISTGSIPWAPAVAQWCNYQNGARSLFALGYPHRAFLLLDICYHRYKSLLSSQHPSMSDLTLGAIIGLLRFGTRLVESFINFAHQMCQIILGTTHPLSILLQKFKGARAENLAHCAVQALPYYTGYYMFLESQEAFINSYGDCYGDMICNKIGDPEYELRSLQHHVQHFVQWHAQEQPENRSNLLAHIHALQCRIAWIHYYARRYEEATELVLGILREPLADARVISGCGCYEILYEIAVAEKKHDTILDILQKAVATSVKAYGYADCVTAAKMARLESHLRSRGCLEEADRIRVD